MILTGLTRDSGEMYQTYFYQVLSVLEELQLCFRMLSLMGQQVVADLAVNEGKNAQRDLVRKLMKGSKWPPLYAAKIPVLHQKTHQVLEESTNMLLPHEVLANIMSWNRHSKQKVFDRAGLSASARKHFEKTVPLLGMDPTTCIPVGLWTDGCPVKWDRSQSVIVITMSFCGQTDDIFSRLRIPLCAF